MTQDKFAEIDIELTDDVLDQLYELAVNFQYTAKSPTNHYGDYFSLPLDPRIDKFISDFKCNMSITRIEPACYVVWHKDVHPQRTCVINLPLKQNKDQITYITDQDILKSFERRNTYTTVDTTNIHRPYVVPYKFKKLSFLNVSEKYHCVFNPTDEYRYLLGIQTGELNYYQGVEYFNNLGLIVN